VTRLILTTHDSSSGNLGEVHRDAIMVVLGPHFIGGPLPTEAELEALLATRTDQKKGDHWLDYVGRTRRLEWVEGRNLGLVEFCDRCEQVELWIDPGPKDQLRLIWLLDYARHHERVISKLVLIQSDVVIGAHSPEEIATWKLPAIKIRNDHLELASRAWRAYRAPTPRDWSMLPSLDLSVLPQLRQTVVEMLEELPGRMSGLGATEMRILELVDPGAVRPKDVFPGDGHANERRVFEYWEFGALLDRLTDSPAPAVSGLVDGPFTMEMHDDRERHRRYWASTLSLTPLGKAILAGTEDFSRHNPIDRWWGGTRLTNKNLWRWDRDNQVLVAP
jgi:hypothetical protein